MTLEITAPATAFVGSTLGSIQSLTLSPPRPQPGIMVNYDLLLSHSNANSIASAKLEAVAFNRFGNIVTSALLSGSGSGERSVTRLDTYWRYDIPHRMETLIVGDTVGVSGGWSRPVRYSGIRWGRNFGMRPGFVTMPQISLAGEAALPSTVEVLVNNARRLSHKVQPGPFDLNNVPLVTGAGEIGLVVRDLLGRETVVRQSYYASPRLLAPSLTDFSIESGWFRTGYGSTSVYGERFNTVTWRQGLNERLTGEVRLELEGGRRAAGTELSGLLATWGVGRLAMAASRSNSQGAGENGTLVQASIERSTTRMGGSLQYEHASRGFAPFGEALGSVALAQRVRERLLASLGGTLSGSITGGLNYVRQTRHNNDRTTLLGVSMSMPLWQGASMSLLVNKQLGNSQNWSAAMSINFQLNDGINIASRLDRGNDGELNGAVSAGRSVSSELGLGWQVQAATTKSQMAQAGLQYHSNQAEWSLDAVTSASGQLATRLGSRGTIGWLEHMPFASRPVGQSSVAVVKVEGIAGVPVKRSHQVVAFTNQSGLAFVPGLLPWQANQIEIDPVDLPLDVEVTSVVQQVTPYPGSGLVVTFPVRRTHQALLVLHQPGGQPVPVGAKTRLLPNGPEFITGRRGEVWLTDLAETLQRVQVTWPKGGCILDLTVAASLDGTPGKIGPVVCE